MQTQNESHEHSAVLSKPNAITLLADDHERVRRLIGEFIRCRDNNELELCQRLAALICDELEIHSTLEEEIFYPTARQIIDDPLVLAEAEIEHGTLKTLIAQIRELQATDPKFMAAINVLGEYVRNHTDEEERELFWMMRKSGMDLESLGGRLAARRRELDGQYGLSHPESAEAMPV